MQQNCKDILERFKDGDCYAYEKLYNLYREDTLRFCNYILNPDSVLELRYEALKCNKQPLSEAKHSTAMVS